MTRNLKAVLVAAVVVTIVVGAYILRSEPRPGAMRPEISSAEYVPAVKAYYEGGKLYFIHTEASDPDVAQTLTEMMGPEVILLPRLADVPDEFLANVYVFTNGVSGGGPFGFQLDIFDSVPGQEDYSPLRAVNLVSWNEGATPRELRTMAELKAAEQAGEVTVERPGIVVNAPVIVWPGGKR